MGGDVHKKKKKHSGDEYHFKGKFNRDMYQRDEQHYALSFMRNWKVQ